MRSYGGTRSTSHVAQIRTIHRQHDRHRYWQGASILSASISAGRSFGIPPPCERRDPRTASAMSSSPPPSGAAGVKPLLIEFYLPCSRICAPNLGSRHPLTTITGARRASGQTHSRARSPQATPTSVPTAPHPNPFHPSGCARAHENSFDHLVGGYEQACPARSGRAPWPS